MKSTTYLSLGFLGLIVLWMLSGVSHSEIEPVKAEKIAQTKAAMKVNVVAMQAKPVSRELVLQGELEPYRQVQIQAQTISLVGKLNVDKGDKVTAGDVLVELDQQARKAQLKKADAEVTSRELELKAARQLKQKGLQSDNFVKAAQAALAAAEANHEQAQLELDYLLVKAPFDGVVEKREVEVGSRVDKGAALMQLVDESKLKAVAFVPQQKVTSLELGQSVKVKLLDGRESTGVITFVARVGDSQTHSFRVEAEIENSDASLNAGTSAQLSILTSETMAHFLSPSIFSLSDEGEVGVKVVNEKSKVDFYPTQVVRTETNGFWITGLPEKAQVITLGQGFVSKGEVVDPVIENQG